MGRIFIVRHGESIANKQGIHQGHMDSPLTELGLEQAKKLAKRLKDEKFDLVYSSDLSRAYNTAKEIMKYHDNEIIIDELLREINKGEWTGKLKEELNLDLLKGKYFKKKFPNGESIIDFWNRLRKFLDLREKDFVDKNVLIVCHGGTKRALLRNLLNLEKEKIKEIVVPNTSITILNNNNGKYSLELLGCNKHLSEL